MTRTKVLAALLSILLLALSPSSKAQENWCTSLGIDLARSSVSTLQAGIEQIEAGEIPDVPQGTPAEIEAIYREALNASLDCVEFLSGRGDAPAGETRPDSLQFLIPTDLDTPEMSGGRTPDSTAADDPTALPPIPDVVAAEDPTALPPIPEIDAAEVREVEAPVEAGVPAPAEAAPAPAVAVPCEFSLAELRELQANVGLLPFITAQQRADLTRQLEAQQGCAGDPAQGAIVTDLLTRLRRP